MAERTQSDESGKRRVLPVPAPEVSRIFYVEDVNIREILGRGCVLRELNSEYKVLTTIYEKLEIDVNF